MSNDDENIVATLRLMARSKASMMELIDYIHGACDAPRYSRGLVMRWFVRAFGLKPLDLTNIIFACEIFGDAASVDVAQTERRFHRRLVELGVAPA